MPATQDYLTFSLPYEQTSSGYFKAIRGLGWPIWLDSGEANQHRGRYDILSAAPTKKLIAENQTSGCKCIATDGSATLYYKDAWEALNSELNLLPQPAVSSEVQDKQSEALPFNSGFMGYLGYDLGRQIESLIDLREDDCGLPLMQMGYYQWAVVQDHLLQQTTLVGEHELGQEFLESLRQSILRPQGQLDDLPDRPFKINALTSNFEEEDYQQQIAQIRRHINAGDCYQVNFSQRFNAHYDGDLLEAYLKLRAALPSPFSCFFETDDGAVLSLSPERFILSADSQLLTQPIKGTAPRGKTTEQDKALAHELQHSSKDQAENLMIVDLLRNDLSKVCQPHSVQTPKLFNLESYANVHHLVSSVTGVLKSGISPIDILAASFPGGSITGAPKIKAMEIIEQLERSRRSVYCGSMGYIDRSGRMDTNIAIRTIAANADELFIWGGGGVVSDSDPKKEYQESLTKIGLIMETLKTPSSKPDVSDS
ncbi:aminodeoxychorismate synthase component I [Pseudomaricurvus sp.]|uniref:aminodeoxychorismate synthase component I n=1 Tax=Pseudomaricurvus sp. TaxID=2004510 RepID=UPI003F6D9754